MASSSAQKYGLSEKETQEMMGTIRCESDWDISITSSTGDVGLVQINPSYWPGITKQQMRDPGYSLNFIAKQFSLHHNSFWVCYNRLYAKSDKEM